MKHWVCGKHAHEDGLVAKFWLHWLWLCKDLVYVIVARKVLCHLYLSHFILKKAALLNKKLESRVRWSCLFSGATWWSKVYLAKRHLEITWNDSTLVSSCSSFLCAFSNIIFCSLKFYINWNKISYKTLWKLKYFNW